MYYEGLGSIRKEPAPKKTGVGYKVFFMKNGKLYPPMVANPGGEDTPIGVWLNADTAPIVGKSKTGRPKVKQGGKGTQGGSGELAFRPGWHLGFIPYAIQFNRKDENGEKTLFPKDFVWAEVLYAKDKNYQKEAESFGFSENGSYRHAYAGLPYLPEDGYYVYRTNPNPDTDPWIITGAMKVNRILTDKEVDDLVRKAGREPQRREQESISSVLSGLGMSVHHNSPYLLKRADGSFIDPETGERLGFDHRFMSSGEGHQVHGWGSYFSVNDLKKYADNGGGVTYKGVKLADIDRVFESQGLSFVIAVQYVMLRIRDGLTVEQAIQKTLQDLNKKDKNSRIDRAIKVLKSLDPSDFSVHHNGHHYHVEIPDNDGTNYIEEDKKLSKKVLNKVVKEFERRGWKYSNTKGGIYLDSPDGDDTLAINPLDNGRILYEKISSLNDFSPKKASELLHDAGFVGIHYYGNQDGECYVIFDENDAKIVGHDLFGVEDTKLTPSQQYQNRRQARASQLKKGDNITYTEDDFFRVECDDLKRVHEAIMYWNEKLPKKSIAWLDDLLLDDKGYPIYTVLEQAELFIESYNLYKDEWKRDFIFADSSSDNEVRLWVMNNRIGRADENLYKEITKVHHKPSLLLIYEWIKKSIIRRDDDAEYEKMVNSYLEKIKKYIDSIKDDELIDKMVNAHKRAFSNNVTMPKQITLAECYKYCGTDENKPSYTGIYHDPKGFAVVTNGLILYAHNNLYESKSKWNIIDKSGKIIDSKFPDWQAVVNRYANNTKILTSIDIDRDDFYRKLCMYERKFKYRRHHIPVQPFAIRYGDNEYLWSAELLKGLVHMSYAHKDVKFYLSVIKYESLRDDVFLVAKSSDGSVGMVGYGVGGFDGWYLDETNKYGLIQDKFTVGEPFLLDSVYQYAQGKQDGKKSNNLQLAKAKMKMAAARIKLMKM